VSASSCNAATFATEIFTVLHFRASEIQIILDIVQIPKRADMKPKNRFLSSLGKLYAPSFTVRISRVS